MWKVEFTSKCISAGVRCFVFSLFFKFMVFELCVLMQPLTLSDYFVLHSHLHSLGACIPPKHSTVLF